MKRILKSSTNTPAIKKFLIPKKQDENNEDWVEITIDYVNDVFTAKKVGHINSREEWEEYNDYTFPSSLLNEFLNSSRK